MIRGSGRNPRRGRNWSQIRISLDFYAPSSRTLIATAVWPGGEVLTGAAGERRIDADGSSPPNGIDGGWDAAARVVGFCLQRIRNQNVPRGTISPSGDRPPCRRPLPAPVPSQDAPASR